MESIPFYRENVHVDEYVIMPNHVHAIIWIDHKIPEGDVASDVSTNKKSARIDPRSLGAMYGRIKQDARAR